MGKEAGKLIIISGPSGAGKTSLAREVMKNLPSLAFSVSATTRKKRETEQEGVDYYFISNEEFAKRAHEGAFAEWEEVYQGLLYGTPHTELNRLWGIGKTAVFDVDATGGLNLKKIYPQHSLAIFIKPPSLDALKTRLLQRKTENPETLAKRLGKAEEEIALAIQFDKVVVNENLTRAAMELEKYIREFLQK